MHTRFSNNRNTNPKCQKDAARLFHYFSYLTFFNCISEWFVSHWDNQRKELKVLLTTLLESFHENAYSASALPPILPPVL